MISERPQSKAEDAPKTELSILAALRARHAALPAEHGAWVFLFSPLAVGLALGGLRPASLPLVMGALAAFLLRQPVIIAVKSLSGRRPKRDLPTAGVWLATYGALGLAALVGLLASGNAFVLWLALPALPVFVWHLWLVSRRAERRAVAVEIAGSGALALAAPAALWVGRGWADPLGWLLWGLCWAQVTGSILFAYLRLWQRSWVSPPGKPAPQSSRIPRGEGLRAALPAAAFNLLALAAAAALAQMSIIPIWAAAAFLIQPLELAWAVLRPAVGVKPKVIGIRQLIVSSLFTVTFILGMMV